MTSQIQIEETKSKRVAAKKSRGEFVTSPVNNFHIRNALHERALRPYLRHRIHLTALVNAGILLSDGRIVCSEEQWNETKDNILAKLQTSIDGRSYSSLDQKIVGVNGRGEFPLGSPRRRPKSATVSLRQYIEKLGEDIASENSDELWGSMSSPHGQGISRGKGLRRGSASSRGNIPKNTSQTSNEPTSYRSTTGKTPALGSMKGAGSTARRGTLDQEASNKGRIFKQNIGPQYTKHEIHASECFDQSFDRNNQIYDSTSRISDKSWEILGRIKGDERDEILKAIKDIVALNKQSKNVSSERLDAVLLSLINRQDRLFRALGERCIEDIVGILKSVPVDFEADHAAIYKAYAPSVRLLELVSDLMNKKLAEDSFFREASRLVKLMGPGQIIEHLERMLSNIPPRRFLHVTSGTVEDDRFALSWSADQPSRETATPLAGQVVDEAMGLAQGLQARIAEQDVSSLKQLGLGSSDAPAALHKRSQRDCLDVEVFTEEHVIFDEHELVCPRPLEPGQSVADLKPVTDRPPTPVPSSGRVRRKSRERLAHGKTPAQHKQKSREIIHAIRRDCEKRLRRRMKHNGWTTYMGSNLEALSANAFPVNSDQLKEQILKRLEEWKALERERNRLLTRVVESISDLVPRVEGEQREKFIRNIAKQVSSIVGTTLKEARDIMFEALNLSEPHLAQRGEEYDSDEIGSVSSIVIREHAKKTEEDEKRSQKRDEKKTEFTGKIKTKTRCQDQETAMLDDQSSIPKPNTNVTETVQTAGPPEETEEQLDAVPELVPAKDDHPPSTTGPSRRQVDGTSEEWSALPAVGRVQRETPSRMVLRCDSDPRLSLRQSGAELTVDIHHHDEHCQHHHAHDEPESELNKLQSSALGFSAERTSSDSKLVSAERAGAPRRSGSADGAPTHPSDDDSHDEVELRVRNPEIQSQPHTVRYY